MTRRRALALIAITMIAASAAIGLRLLGIGTGLELESVDARFRVHGPMKPPAGVVLVQVDEKTLSDLHRRWPFPRAVQAQLIDRLAAARPRAIAIDLQYTEPTTVDDDNALIEAIHRAGHVVLATTAVNDQGQTNVLGGDAVVDDIGARVGSALMPLDDDGAIRRAADEVEGLESFAVVSAEMATNRQVAPFDSSRTWIRFAGPPGTLRAYSYSDVLRGRVPPAAFRNRVVVVGTSAVRLKDASTTSTTRGSLMSGPEVQGNAIATVLAGLPLSSPGGAVDTALILLLAALAPLAALRLGAVGVTLASALAALAFLAVAQWLFAGGLIVGVVHPVAALLAGLIGVVAVARPGARSAPAVTALAAPEPAETVADEVAGFRLEGLIGRGGMGVVYRARQPGLDRVVAVKVIDPARAADPGFRERFAREARLAAAIEHPNIVPVYSTGEDRGRLYLVMRYIDGVNLAERLGEGPLALSAVAEIVVQVASALDAAHLRGLIHRDVKPANILLAEHHAFLTDFGITRELDATAGLTRTGVFVGSVEYAAPEQAAGAGPAADQYSLGCVAYECLTGVSPFGRERDLRILWAHAHEVPRPPSALAPDLPADLDAAVLRALAKEPGERWATCTEFAQRLAGALLGRV